MANNPWIIRMAAGSIFIIGVARIVDGNNPAAFLQNKSWRTSWFVVKSVAVVFAAVGACVFRRCAAARRVFVFVEDH